MRMPENAAPTLIYAGMERRKSMVLKYLAGMDEGKYKVSGGGTASRFPLAPGFRRAVKKTAQRGGDPGAHSSCEEAREVARIMLAKRRPFATQPQRYAASRQ